MCSTQRRQGAGIRGQRSEELEIDRSLATSRSQSLSNANILKSAARDSTISRASMSIFPAISSLSFADAAGSGKSSLAMDTIYAEGQRRYVESLSAYARQFVGQMQKPKLDHIEGLSPAIAIEQKHSGHSPRSTVGTVTEIYDYLRILLSPAGHAPLPHMRYTSRHSIFRRNHRQDHGPSFRHEAIYHGAVGSEYGRKI